MTARASATRGRCARARAARAAAPRPPRAGRTREGEAPPAVAPGGAARHRDDAPVVLVDAQELECRLAWWIRAGHSVKRCHHMLDLRVLLEGVDRHVLAVAALLVAAMGHLVDERDVRVDPDRAELQLAGHAKRAPDVSGPDRRGKPVVHP